MRVSSSKKTILLAVHALPPHKWLIVDLKRLKRLIDGYLCEIDILETDEENLLPHLRRS